MTQPAADPWQPPGAPPASEPPGPPPPPPVPYGTPGYPPYPPPPYPPRVPYGTPGYPLYPPPGTPTSPEPSVPGEPPLDAAVREGRHIPGHWFVVGLLQALNPFLSIIPILVVVLVAGLPRDDDAGTVYEVVGGLLGAGLVWLTGRGIARAHGGWQQAYGLVRPTWRDARTALGWFCLQFVARIALAVALNAIAPSVFGPHGGNTEGASSVSTAGKVMLLVGAVLIAPVVEETAFRGIVLRGLMRRMRFWPAALLASAIFASLHIPGAAHPSAIPLLVSTIFLFGLLQCVLVRRTGRLAPAMGVHALLNLVVTLLSFSA